MGLGQLHPPRRPWPGRRKWNRIRRVSLCQHQPELSAARANPSSEVRRARASAEVSRLALDLDGVPSQRRRDLAPRVAIPRWRKSLPASWHRDLRSVPKEVGPAHHGQHEELQPSSTPGVREMVTDCSRTRRWPCQPVARRHRWPAPLTSIRFSSTAGSRAWSHRDGSRTLMARPPVRRITKEAEESHHVPVLPLLLSSPRPGCWEYQNRRDRKGLIGINRWDRTLDTLPSGQVASKSLRRTYQAWFRPPGAPDLERITASLGRSSSRRLEQR